LGKHPRLLRSRVREKKKQRNPVRDLQKLENMCTAINLDSYKNWSMKGKKPTVYWWIIWRSLRLLSWTK